MAEGWTHHEGVVNNVRLHWVEQGAGPLVVLLRLQLTERVMGDIRRQLEARRGRV